MPALTDRVRFRSPKQLPGLELVEASYRNRAFPVHGHEEYVIGVTMAGAERLDVRGRQLVAQSGDFILIEPHEAHANQTLGDKELAYRVFYVPAIMLSDTFGKVRFRANVLQGKALARRWASLHRCLMTAGEHAELQDVFFGLLGEIIEMAAGALHDEKPAERRLITRAREFLDSHLAEPVSLSELASVTGLSSYHLLRSFRDQVGITPGAYQIQLRVHEARRRLRNGAGIADTAADLGFADQSHLSRHFQRIIGISPGRYAQQ